MASVSWYHYLWLSYSIFVWGILHQNNLEREKGLPLLPALHLTDHRVLVL